MRRSRGWPLWVVMILVGVAAGAGADLPCAECTVPAAAEGLDADALVGRIASTLFEDGLSFLLLAAFAVVGMPWLVAAVAIAAFYLPRWLKAPR